MPLTSQLFKDDDNLQRCLVSPTAHVTPGIRGPHVGKRQQALIILGAGVIDPGEIAGTFYGTTTVRAVLAFKGPPRNIINRTYQQTPDNIVGQMTIQALDLEMRKFDEQPPSLLVSVTAAGSPHDHTRCPRLEAGEHEGTPINPLGFGLKLNIFGDHETDYLGFQDVSTDIEFISRNEGGPRRLTFDRPGQPGLPSGRASDICMRSSPVTDEDFTRRTGKPNTISEIKRLAMPGCRLTYGGSEVNIASFGAKIQRLGVLMERVLIKTPGRVEPLGTVVPPSTFTVFVLTLLGFSKP